MNNYIIALDVGGTSVHAGVIRNCSSIVKDTTFTYPAYATGAKEQILSNLAFIIKDQIDRLHNSLNLHSERKWTEKNGVVVGIGIAFPGPFDYTRGICYIKDLGKFDSLYGVNLEEELRKRITPSEELSIHLKPDYKVVFENDASLFALGANEVELGLKCSRIICLTLGTGFGTAFLEDGQFVKGRYGIPESGTIYNDPFKGGILDDFLSRRGILRIAAQKGFDPNNMDVKELADLARTGNMQAVDIFQKFGHVLGLALRPYISSFKPQAIIVGGQIAKSHDLFLKEFQHVLSDREIVIKFTVDPLFCTFMGAAKLHEKSC
jgi:glucokinase